MKISSQEKFNLGEEFEAKNNDIQKINCEILKKVNSQNVLQNELNKFNSTNLQIQNTIKGQEDLANVLKCENENLNNCLAKEKSNRTKCF